MSSDEKWLMDNGFIKKIPGQVWKKDYAYVIMASICTNCLLKRWQCFIQYQGSVHASFDHMKMTYAYGDTAQEAYENARRLMLAPIHIKELVNGLDAVGKKP